MLGSRRPGTGLMTMRVMATMPKSIVAAMSIQAKTGS